MDRSSRRWGVVSLALAGSLLAAGATAPAATAAAADRHPKAANDFAGSKWGDDKTREGKKASAGTGRWDPTKDNGSMVTTARTTGAQDVWKQDVPAAKGVKITGQGVGVALVDTGIAPVAGLDAPGKVVNGPDLSFSSQDDTTRYVDGFGHGTHMASIIAGRDSSIAPGDGKGKEGDAGTFLGMAPGATLVNVKVGASNGAADVSQIIAAVDWVVAHKDATNTRVLNLSYGLDSTLPSTSDPLAHAVENAWRAGIVVVAAAGNDGERGATTLTMPAADPYVIAVGSSDHSGSDRAQDRVLGAWTNPGTDARRPDLLAPGRSIVGLRAPGSEADVQHPEGLVTGDTTGRLFRGTGTSQSAAVVSGAAALLLQRDPGLTPDQVKGLLEASADPLSSPSPAQGAGVLDVKGAVDLLKKSGAGAAAQQSFPVSTGLGSLEAARGGSHVANAAGEELTGEQDIFGVPWDAPAWAQASALRNSWRDGTWSGSQWAGSGWGGSSAEGGWSRNSWRAVDWSRNSWRADAWSRNSWRSGDWSRNSWRDVAWSRNSWRSSGF